MNWGKVIYIFFALMSLTTTAGFLYDQNEVALFIAACVNLISTLLKIGVRNFLAAELFASSLVADLHLIPAFALIQINPEANVMVYTLAIGALIANIFSMILVVVDSVKSQEEN
ncbi:TPA: DUF6394 family protein [Campylobacter lari subsp. concheus]|uniref:DUF6394 family protein n=1 Tax=Campylobacter TaxID=194 RepID=UPI000B3FB58B|nr:MULTISPECIES: DUF6394 family protein [Campylobacter]MCR8686680.1 DUF6394 family protein [Campylobacter sp. 1569]EAJ6150189.1 hypothetical protein [Campylobacter lari]MBT0814983.1 hypothetical protein [Campylobacter lari]MBT0824908.1 hypothetical protein [Campylobacter lari]MCV3551338.1 DUF6394 family protein [Campylobacter sp. CNRCH_2013_0855]